MQTVAEECDPIRNLWSIIESDSPNGELIKEESDVPCYSGNIQGHCTYSWLYYPTVPIAQWDMTYSVVIVADSLMYV